MKTRFVLYIIALLLLLSPSAGQAEEPLPVVATLSTFASLAQMIGGDAADVRSVVPPQFNAHFFEPRPSDVLRMRKAALFIHGGLDLERWREPLITASARASFKPGGSEEVDLSSVVTLLNVPSRAVTRAEGDIHLFGNPHYWQSAENGRKMAHLIAERLVKARPAHEKLIRDNLTRFEKELGDHEKEWKSLLAPLQGRELIGYHDEWVYLITYMGLKMDAFLEEKPGISPGPRHLAAIQDLIRIRGIKLIAQASFYPRNSSDYVARNTGAKVVILCQNVGELEQCSDYIGMLNHNIRSIAQALTTD